MTKMTKTKKARTGVRMSHERITTGDPIPKLVEAAPVSLLKLDLGSGLTVRDGFEGVDIRGGKAKHVVDLFKYPWPFKDDSVDEIVCNHLMEHIPAREVEERDLVRVQGLGPIDGKRSDKEILIDGVRYVDGSYLGADMLFAFMDECWRIMKVGAWMNVVVPSGRSDRAFWDPTHRRFLMQATFLYFAQGWRIVNGLEHYRISCNFGVDVGHTQPAEEGLRASEVQQDRLAHYWNVTVDWIGKMQKQAPLTDAQIAEFVAQRERLQAGTQANQVKAAP